METAFCLVTAFVSIFGRHEFRMRSIYIKNKLTTYTYTILHAFVCKVRVDIFKRIPQLCGMKIDFQSAIVS